MVEIATVSSNRETQRAIKQAINKYKILSDENTISFSNKNIGAKVANSLLSDISDNYNDFINSLSHDHQDRSDTVIYKEFENTGYKVVITGNQVIYDEFGTGDNGLLFPHPNKDRYSLDDYNSGPSIRTDKNGLHYWTYEDINGDWVTSHGVPSGQFIYNSLNNAWNNSSLITLEEVKKNNKRVMKG